MLINTRVLPMDQYYRFTDSQAPNKQKGNGPRVEIVSAKTINAAQKNVAH